MTKFYESDIVSVERGGGNRLLMNIRGKRVCNISIGRLVSVTEAPDDNPQQKWLAMRGPFTRVDFARKDGASGLVGPLPTEELPKLIEAISKELSLPLRPVVVSEAQIRENPDVLNDTLIELTAVWSKASQESTIAGGWLYVPPNEVSALPDGEYHAKITAFFHCSGSRNLDGFRDGHGPYHLSPYEMDVFTIELVASS